MPLVMEWNITCYFISFPLFTHLFKKIASSCATYRGHTVDCVVGFGGLLVSVDSLEFWPQAGGLQFPGFPAMIFHRKEPLRQQSRPPEPPVLTLTVLQFHPASHQCSAWSVISIWLVCSEDLRPVTFNLVTWQNCWGAFDALQILTPRHRHPEAEPAWCQPLCGELWGLNPDVLWADKHLAPWICPFWKPHGGGNLSKSRSFIPFLLTCFVLLAFDVSLLGELLHCCVTDSVTEIPSLMCLNNLLVQIKSSLSGTLLSHSPLRILIFLFVHILSNGSNLSFASGPSTHFVKGVFPCPMNVTDCYAESTPLCPCTS